MNVSSAPDGSRMLIVRQIQIVYVSSTPDLDIWCMYVVRQIVQVC